MRCYRTVGILLETHLHISVKSVPMGQKPCLLGLVGLYCVPRMAGLRDIITSPGPLQGHTACCYRPVWGSVNALLVVLLVPVFSPIGDICFSSRVTSLHIRAVFIDDEPLKKQT